MSTIVFDDIQLMPKRVPVNGYYLLRVLAHEEIQYADTTLLETAIDMVAQYTPSDYKDFSGAAAAVAAAQALLNAKPTVDRQDEVDAAAMAIFDAIGALEWA